MLSTFINKVTNIFYKQINVRVILLLLKKKTGKVRNL